MDQPLRSNASAWNPTWQTFWLLLCAIVGPRLWAQEAADSDRASTARQAGLVATYKVGGDSFTRIDSDLLFAGATSDNRFQSDARLPTTSFQAEWISELTISEPGTYRFHFWGSGNFKLWLGEKLVLQVTDAKHNWSESHPVELAFGQVAVRAEYESLESERHCGLYWSSNRFPLEPIESQFYSTRIDANAAADMTHGRQLARALRCHACHNFSKHDSLLPQSQIVMRTPSLAKVSGNLHEEWIIQHLMAAPPDEVQLAERRMPYFELSRADARAVAAALHHASNKPVDAPNWEAELSTQNAKRKKNTEPVRTTANIQQGLRSFVTLGCIACHQAGELGSSLDAIDTVSALYDGGNLAHLLSKRPSEAIARWLDDPATVNTSHRMPRFDLSLHEKLDIHAWLTSESPPSDAPNSSDASESADNERGVQLIQQLKCVACHELPVQLIQAVDKSPISDDATWSNGCLDKNNQQNPRFGLSKSDIQDLRAYLKSSVQQVASQQPEQLLLEQNCLGCHRRGNNPGIFRHFLDLAENYHELATELPSMTPPALNGVGDKLHAQALQQALGKQPLRLRDWLAIRMPQFDLSRTDSELLAGFFISHDRIPDHGASEKDQTVEQSQEYWLAAGRLVTPDGFSCQSCHQIVDSHPSGIAMNAHGTDLTLLGKRIREPWFYRWVKNPSRIVPRMEMPAIQSAVHGVLGDSLDAQLHALWQTLNRPDFRPPKPNPVRIVRNYNDGQDSNSVVLTDVIEAPELIVRPLVLGLTNRHNILIDLQHGGIQQWWIGDVARQHTRGKSWYWEPGAPSLIPGALIERWSIIDSAGQTLIPRPLTGRQFAKEIDSLEHIGSAVRVSGRLHFGLDNSSGTQTLTYIQTWQPTGDREVQATTRLSGLLPGQSLAVDSCGKLVAEGHAWTAKCDNGPVVRYTATANTELQQREVSSVKLTPVADAAQVSWTTQFASTVAADRFPRLSTASEFRPPRPLDCVPGFQATELPLPRNEMPISFGWDANGNCYAGSLKGRVLKLVDRDGDKLFDDYQLVSDEIPTPYGIQVSDAGMDVVTKYGLLRLTTSSGGPIMNSQVVADGWGYSHDYHDWAVGLERAHDGTYYITLPCQQDDRSVEAAQWRGHALRLIPLSEPENNRLYRIESFAAGLRFPMGIALNKQGDLFVSDNQGNYTPFNELNHLRYGKRYGFINKLEAKQGFASPFESPAINIPHPWVRSVNGICFLNTPEDLSPTAEQFFGPHEGHLIGCEMNGRSLVRMSLQEVNGEYQGAVYPFSRPDGDADSGFEGPIACRVAPNSDIYVGNLHDSGWGGGNNTGSVVVLRPTAQLPLGIREVRAQSDGLEIEFAQPIDRSLAVDRKNYSIRSYIRTPTPAYGGDDQAERIEQPRQITADQNGLVVHIRLDDLRSGAVYELNVGNIGPGRASLFPNQAHYTMRSIPE